VNEVRLKARSGVQLLARLPESDGGNPLLATGTYGSGRTLAWTSDVGPHWLPQTFAQWRCLGDLYLTAPAVMPLMM
jgi:uncharacterized membrane protein